MPKSVQEILVTPTILGGIIEHRDWILEATDEQLDEYILHTASNQFLYPMAVSERQRRHFKHLSNAAKPHWTLTPTFWISVGVLIVSLAILTVAMLSWLFPKTPPIPNDKPAISMTNFVSIPTNSPQTKATTNQTLPPAIYTMPGTNILNR
jgi:hypothetical protein